MALEAVVFHHDPTYSYGGSRDLYSIAGGFCYPGGLDRKDEKPLCGENHNILMKEFHWEAPTFSSSPENNSAGRDGFQQLGPEEVLASATRCRRKRRRAKNVKNEEQVENQRMTHIAVERNRRRQMNEYLAVLRSMMPASFVQRGDQASIVGGAINFVKELEQLLQSLEGHEKMTEFHQASEININGGFSSSLFSDFFAFPQFSTSSSNPNKINNSSVSLSKSTAEKQLAIADVEVTMVETHVNLKILSRRQPKQLLKMIARLPSLGLTILHLNLTASQHMVLYSFSVKVEDDCQLGSVNEIAAAVYEMVVRIQEEAKFIN
ncbi:transcription factor bHLH94-like isoform X2 [Carica papaya]|nr:transcription factor bHLH94-like isoform X2 [Carica papaya]XP_021897561.1 transcription factor bHLH94-like isoform X2 [Carica papaya]